MPQKKFVLTDKKTKKIKKGSWKNFLNRLNAKIEEHYEGKKITHANKKNYSSIWYRLYSNLKKIFDKKISNKGNFGFCDLFARKDNKLTDEDACIVDYVKKCCEELTMEKKFSHLADEKIKKGSWKNFLNRLNAKVKEHYEGKKITRAKKEKRSSIWYRLYNNLKNIFDKKISNKGNLGFCDLFARKYNKLTYEDACIVDYVKECCKELTIEKKFSYLTDKPSLKRRRTEKIKVTEEPKHTEEKYPSKRRKKTEEAQESYQQTEEKHMPTKLNGVANNDYMASFFGFSPKTGNDVDVNENTISFESSFLDDCEDIVENTGYSGYYDEIDLDSIRMPEFKQPHLSLKEYSHIF